MLKLCFCFNIDSFIDQYDVHIFLADEYLFVFLNTQNQPHILWPILLMIIFIFHFVSCSSFLFLLFFPKVIRECLKCSEKKGNFFVSKINRKNMIKWFVCKCFFLCFPHFFFLLFIEIDYIKFIDNLIIR